MKSWFLIDDTLETVEYDGPSQFRLPEEIAETVIQEFSSPGEWILDPFCGFGTTVHVAQRLGRNAVGVEKITDRAEFAEKNVHYPSRIINDSAEHLGNYTLPPFDLLFTSPPYFSFRQDEARYEDKIGFIRYYDDLHRIFVAAKNHMKSGALVVVEIANVKRNNKVLMLAWNVAQTLSKLFVFEGEIVCCNTKSRRAASGYEHSYLLLFRV